VTDTPFAAATPDRAALLALYDEHLRAEGEVPSADSVERVGPVLVARYGAERGFVTYRDLGGLDAEGIADLVARVVRPLLDDPAVDVVEWKTRGHDEAPGLDEALRAHGLQPQEVESVMIGAASALALDLPLPHGVTIRRVEDEGGLRAAEACAAAVFDSSPQDARRIADEIVRRVMSGRDDLEMWVAEHDGQVISCGRLEPVGDCGVAGIWGGATLPQWRRQGVYRALTAERARSAMRRGVRWIHSDSTEGSRPVLERSGLVRVTTTTPYEWRRTR